MALVSKLKFNIEQQEIDGKQVQKREKKEEIEGIKEGEWEVRRGEIRNTIFCIRNMLSVCKALWWPPKNNN